MPITTRKEKICPECKNQEAKKAKCKKCGGRGIVIETLTLDDIK
jgi:DnaJ-class molecular chaperone